MDDFGVRDGSAVCNRERVGTWMKRRDNGGMHSYPPRNASVTLIKLCVSNVALLHPFLPLSYQPVEESRRKSIYSFEHLILTLIWTWGTSPWGAA